MQKSWCLLCKTISKVKFLITTLQISKKNKSSLISTTLLGAYPISYITSGLLVECLSLFIFGLGLNGCNSIGGKAPLNHTEAEDTN